MIVKIKSYYLKKNVEPKALEQYGFEKCGDNYSKELKDLDCDIRYYGNTRRFVYVNYPLKDGRSRKVKRHIVGLIKADLVELRINYEWLAIIGRWQNYSQKKIDRIRKKMDRLNKVEELE